MSRGSSLGALGAVLGLAALGTYCARQAPARAPIVASAGAERGPSRVELVAAGDSHSCALLDDGALRCWGSDAWGQLGVVPRPSLPDGSRGSALPLPAFVLEGASALALGRSQTCLLDEAGVVRCVGERVHLEDSRKAPVAPLTLDVGEPVSALAAGGGFACVLFESSGGACFGKQAHDSPLRGALGTTTRSGIQLAQLGEALTISAIGAGSDVCAITEDGAVRCWRSTEELRETEAMQNTEELTLPAPAKAISVNSDYGGCALLESGAVHCWYGGQSGPIAVSAIALDGPARQVEAGGFFSCAVLSSGGLRCWGHSKYFEAAAKPLTKDVFAVEVGAAVKSVAVGELHACALLESGAVRCFGHNASGQLGYGHLRDIGDDESILSAGDVPVLGRPAPVPAWQAPPPSASSSG